MEHSFGPAVADAVDTTPAQRGTPRNAMFLNADLRRPGAATGLTLRVRNLSAGGLMVETSAPFERGEAVTIGLRNIGDIAGRIAWIARDRLGIAFDRPIDPAEARKAPPQSPGAAMMLIKAESQSRRPGLKIG